MTGEEYRDASTPEPTITRKAGGLDFTARGGKRQGPQVSQSLKTMRRNRGHACEVPGLENQLDLNTGRDRQMGFFFLIVVGFDQRFYKSEVFSFASYEMNSDAELVGSVSPAINHLAFDFDLVFVQIEKHQG